jgi:hypothetical protein
VQEVLMEHFGFTPSAFSRQAVDFANDVIYQAMDSIDKVVRAQLGTSDEVDKVGPAVNSARCTFIDPRVQGLLRLETLLESLVDLRFDQYEAYLHRNVFVLQPSLVPYLQLDHHPSTGLPDSLRGTDEALLKDLDEERRLYEHELDEKHCMDLADERIQRRLAALSAAETELAALGLPTEQHQGSSLAQRKANAHAREAQASKDLDTLSKAIPELISSLKALQTIDPPLPATTKIPDREAYLAKAVPARLSKVMQETALNSSLVDKGDGRDALVERVKEDMAASGSTGDAQVCCLLSLLGRGFEQDRTVAFEPCWATSRVKLVVNGSPGWHLRCQIRCDMAGVACKWLVGRGMALIAFAERQQRICPLSAVTACPGRRRMASPHRSCAAGEEQKARARRSRRCLRCIVLGSG